VILSIDLETRSPVDLKRSGPYRYFEHPVTDILCLAYAIDDGPVHGWTPGQPCPDIIRAVVADRDSEISGWNVNFERQGWRAILGRRHGWPVPVLEQFRDTAAQAAAQTLPRRLEDVAAVMRLPERKDHDGAKLMMAMAKPRKRRKEEPEGPIYWNDGDLPRLLEYCKQDVVVERMIRHRLRPLSNEEMLLWRFDQLINDRGICIDLDLVDDMRVIVERHSAGLNAKMREATDGCLTACSQTERLKDWIRNRCGVDISSLGKGVIDSVFAHPDLDPVALEALHLWQEAARASVRKLQAAELCANGDSRARGLLRFHGANTGRWSGQLLQPQNFTRGSGLVTEEAHDFAIEVIRQRDPFMLDLCWGEPLTVISDCLRGIMTAGPGKQLMAGDYKNIEARITAWLSFNDGKLGQFARQDAHPGDPHHEVYTISAAEIYHCAVEAIDKAKRQVGKTAELALGFGGGVDALIGMGRNYRVDLAPALPGLLDAATPEERDKVHEAYALTLETGNMKAGLSRDAWLAAKFIVRAWRRANKPTVDMWDQFHRAAWHAFDGEPSEQCRAGRVSFRLDRGFLWLTLPSGRSLAYPTPAVENRLVPWSDKRLPVQDQEHKDMLTVLYFLPSGHKDRYPFYPGLTFQHAVQAIARDVLAHGMANAERAGFPIVMSIHDEAIAEVDVNRDDLDTFLDAMVDMPEWADDLPILADGWAGFRYRKV
jgi:DNA polymerase